MGQYVILYNFKNLFPGFSAFFTRSFSSWWQGVFGKLFKFFVPFQIFIENQETTIFAVCNLLHDKVVDSLEEMLVVLRCFRICSDTSTSKKKLQKLGLKKAVLVTVTIFKTRKPNSKSNGDTQIQFEFFEVFQVLRPTSKVFIYSYLVSCLSRASNWCLQWLIVFFRT